MIDLHTHSLLSDGKLLPSELVRRAEVFGYEAIAITDHADASNLDIVIKSSIEVVRSLNEAGSITILPGVELTHLPPILISDLVKRSRELGARIIIVHGETIIEPVARGTNMAALRCEIDILAHPGLLTIEEAILAREKGIYLEISARSGHSFTNGHVVKVAMEAGASLILNTDAHGQEDLIDEKLARKIIQGAGLGENDFENLLANSRDLIKRCSSL